MLTPDRRYEQATMNIEVLVASLREHGFTAQANRLTALEVADPGAAKACLDIVLGLALQKAPSRLVQIRDWTALGLKTLAQESTQTLGDMFD